MASGEKFGMDKLTSFKEGVVVVVVVVARHTIKGELGIRKPEK